MIPVLLIYKDWALLILRLAVGVIFIVHGLPKLKSLKTTAKNFGMMGFKPGLVWGAIVAVLEGVGGFLILLGVFTQVLGLLLTIQMLVAIIWKIKKGQKLAGGYEFDVILAAAGLILATMGGGALTIWF